MILPTRNPLPAREHHGVSGLHVRGAATVDPPVLDAHRQTALWLRHSIEVSGEDETSSRTVGLRPVDDEVVRDAPSPSRPTATRAPPGRRRGLLSPVTLGARGTRGGPRAGAPSNANPELPEGPFREVFWSVDSRRLPMMRVSGAGRSRPEIPWFVCRRRRRSVPGRGRGGRLLLRP